MNIYRTYHNLQLGANAQIHSVLLALEKVEKDEGRIPDVVYIQIDGGPENVSKSVLGMCELLVASGVTKKIVLSRLMVGHTHEDIDSKFALIWRRIRSAFALTMSHYKHSVESALRHDGLTSEVVDLFATPDYDKLLRPLIDKNFGRYAKRFGSNDWTVLEFTVEGIEDIELLKYFPAGVKTTYRPYAADNVLRIVKDSKAPLRMTVDQLGPITAFPPADPELGLPEGFSILDELPDCVPDAEPFVVGSHQLLHDVTHKMLHKFNSDATQPLHDEWKNFRDHIAPQSDSVEDYIAENPLHIPFRKELYERRRRLDELIESRVTTIQKEYGERSRKSIPLDYVQSSKRKKKRGDPALLHPSMVVEGPPGVTYSEPVYCSESNRRPRNSSNDSPVPDVQLKAVIDSTLDNLEECLSSDEDPTDSEVEDSMNLVTCRTPRALPHNYGNPLGFVGWKFQVMPKYARRAEYANKCADGIIAAVVRPPGCRNDYTQLMFKFYNYKELSEAPPDGSPNWVYVPCTQFLSSSDSRRMMKWVTVQNDVKKHSRGNREKNERWEYTTAPPSGVFDRYDRSTLLSDEDMNTGPRTRSQRKLKRTAEATFASSQNARKTLPISKKIRANHVEDVSVSNILEEHKKFKENVHHRVREKVAKLREKAKQRGEGEKCIEKKQIAGVDATPNVRQNFDKSSQQQYDGNNDVPCFQGDDHVLLSDLSDSSDEAYSDSDEEEISGDRIGGSS